MQYQVWSEPNSEGAAVEEERLWAVESKVDSEKIVSDDGSRLS